MDRSHLREETNDLIKRLLLELGQDFYASPGFRIDDTALQVVSIPTYNVRRKGRIFRSMALQLCGKYVDNEDYHATSPDMTRKPSGPTRLAYYIVFQPATIPPSLREILHEKKIPEWDRHTKEMRWYDIYSPQSLEDIDLSVISSDMDVGIANLVRALLALNFHTMDSCEGHIDRGNKYPSILFRRHKSNEKLDKMIREYNGVSSIKWEVAGNPWGTPKFGALRPSTFASHYDELRSLQENSDNFAHFLFTNYVNK